MKQQQRKKDYKKMVNDYYDLVTRGYREILGSDFFHPYLWPDGKDKAEALDYTHQYIFNKLNTFQIDDVPLSSAKVADYGCGIGAFSILLSQKFKNVIAINFNKKQLAIAEKNIKQQKIANIELVEADIMQTSFKDMFDVVFLYDVAPHLPNKEKALQLIWKALKPGGKLVMTEWLIPQNISSAARMLLVEPFNSTWAFPFLETDENYMKYFKKNDYKLLLKENWTKKIDKSITVGYHSCLKAINSFGIKDVARVLDLSMVKHAMHTKEKMKEMSEMVLYLKALYDSNNFLYFLYIAEKI